MKVIVAGSRTITDISLVEKAIKDSGFVITEIVYGLARGVDSLAVQYATLNHIPVKGFPAKWEKLGRAAGPIRNVEMGEYADAAVIIHDGVSKGTANMLYIMKTLKKPVYYVKVTIETHRYNCE